VADDGAFGAELLTPEAPLFSGAARAVISRTKEGDLTVLDGHTDLVGDVVATVVRIERADGSTEAFCVHGGFLQVRTAPGAASGLVDGVGESERSTRATLLAGVAEPVEGIDVARAQAAREAATAALSALASRDDDEARLERELQERALARATLRLEAQGAAVAQ
jgi:F-type H+-transporting ATPase subunit epsilon